MERSVASLSKPLRLNVGEGGFQRLSLMAKNKVPVDSGDSAIGFVGTSRELWELLWSFAS